MALRLFIVDEHELVRLGLRATFASKPDWQICGEARNSADALAKIEQMQPEVVIANLSAARGNGVDEVAAIRGAAPAARIVFYSMECESATAKPMGADELVCKTAGAKELVAAVERAARKVRSTP